VTQPRAESAPAAPAVPPVTLPAAPLPDASKDTRQAARIAAAERAAAQWRQRENARIAEGGGSEEARYGWSPSATLTPWPPQRPWEARDASSRPKHASRGTSLASR
jgi:hypothetical protein